MRPPPFHVLVDLTGTWSDPSPGVLIAWRQARQGWEAWVIFAAPHPTGGGSQVQVTQSWVPAHLVRPAEVERPEADLSAYRPAGGATFRAREEAPPSDRDGREGRGLGSSW